MLEKRTAIKIHAQDHQALKVIGAKTGLTQTVLLTLAVRLLASQFPELKADFEHDYVDHPRHYKNQFDEVSNG